METDFKPTPHTGAAADIRQKPALPSSIFYDLPKELRNRAFTISGITDISILKRVQELLAQLPEGKNWNDQRDAIADQLTPDLGPDGALKRSTLLLQTQCFQAFQADNWQLAQADEDTVALQFLTTEDEKVCPWCSPLNGIIMPKNDSFWEGNFPPKHIGCRCRTRSMNPDMVADEKEADKKRLPEHKLVPEGPMLAKLREGTIIRDALPAAPPAPGEEGAPRQLRQSQTFQILPPESKTGWAFNPNNLRISMATIRATYGGYEAEVLEMLAKTTLLDDGQTLWKWLNEDWATAGSLQKTLPLPSEPSPGSEAPSPKTELPAPLKDNISTHMVIKSKTIEKIANQTMASIDKVHGDGGMPEVHIDGNPGPDRLGAFDRNKKRARDGSITENTISVRKGTDHPHLCFAHETGHYIDWRAFPGLPEDTPMSESPLAAAWHEAIKETDSYKAMLARRSREADSYLDYLLKPRELWARSYAQFIAQKSGDAALLSELKSEQEGLLSFIQWQEKDFVKVGQEIEKLLHSLNWL